MGSDGLGNYVVLMLAGSECGSVFFWNHEGAQATRLAESFTEFLPLLEGPEPQ